MIYFGAAYYPEHRDPARWEHDLDLMAAAKVNALRVGEFAWRRLEPADGRYAFAWMDDFAAKAFRRGIRLVMCPPLRTAPAWLATRYGSIAAMNAAWGNVFWGLEYDRFGQVPTPRLTKADHNPAHWLAWRRFRSDCTVEVVRLHAAALRAHARQYVTTNNQCLRRSHASAPTWAVSVRFWTAPRSTATSPCSTTSRRAGCRRRPPRSTAGRATCT